ncbi:Tim17/Tim22/Tim23/Pmp24 family-domain-containing protein [Tuber brumale]|nr:Tim17/Tim22/Tim23/Pmp24 family-domain-containing protein [Tuber brumale]
MSFWDNFTGRKTPRQLSTMSTATISPGHPSDSGDIAPTSSFTQQNTFDPTGITSVSSFLTPAVADPAVLHPLAGLDKGLSYLDLEETALSTLPGAQTALPSRGFGDDLCYGTGTTYLLALSLGGAWGFAEGLSRSQSNAPPRLRLNAVLNAMTRRGPFLGNSAGVLALVYNGVNYTVGSVRGKHDTANSIISGVVAGAIFKSTRGIRPVLVSSGIVGAAAGVWAIGLKALL